MSHFCNTAEIITFSNYCVFSKSKHVTILTAGNENLPLEYVVYGFFYFLSILFNFFKFVCDMSDDNYLEKWHRSLFLISIFPGLNFLISTSRHIF